MRKLVGLLFATLAVYVIPFTKTFAQNTDVQSWTQVITQINLNKEWFAYMEAQPRAGDDISRLERLLIRPAIGYNINPNIALFLGYAWTPTFMNNHYQEDFRNENRIWQQVLIKDSRWGLDWQHRLRQEQRFIQDAAGPSNRTRYLLRGSYSLSVALVRGYFLGNSPNQLPNIVSASLLITETLYGSPPKHTTSTYGGNNHPSCSTGAPLYLHSYYLHPSYGATIMERFNRGI